MPSSLLSIIMPVYNRESLLPETLRSVQSQSFTDWELIAVDDGSTDKSFAWLIAEAQNDPRLRPMRREREPKSAATCRNIGLANACGDHVLFLDSDDLLPPTCLKERMDKLQDHPDADGVVFGCRVFTSSPELSEPYPGCDAYHDPVLNFLTCPVPWFITSPVWRRENLDRLHGTFDERLHATQDWEFHLRLLLQGANVIDRRPAAPFLCRRGNRSISSSNRNLNYLRSYLDATLRISRLARLAGRGAPERALLQKRLRFACLRLLKHGDTKGVRKRLHQIQTEDALPGFQVRALQILTTLRGGRPASFISRSFYA